ncbi:MAG: cell division protein ZapA [Novosphingobium sp.]
MSNVTLSIGGRTFTVACAEGEEAHVAGLGRMIDTKVSSMGDLSGQSEPRMLLFAALLLADELHDLRTSPPAATEASPAPGLSALAGQQLESIATRLENLASRLEGEATSA